MKLKQQAKLLVKLKSNAYDFPKWMEYRMSKGRNLHDVQKWLIGLDSFRYAVIYAYNEKTKQRGNKVGYIDKFRIDY